MLQKWYVLGWQKRPLYYSGSVLVDKPILEEEEEEGKKIEEEKRETNNIHIMWLQKNFVALNLVDILHRRLVPTTD